jgi:predicted DNA-binding transcriptional regulator AlpA
LHSPVSFAFDERMPRYTHRSLAASDILLPHQVADFIGLDETEIWKLVRARQFPMPGLI